MRKIVYPIIIIAIVFVNIAHSIDPKPSLQRIYAFFGVNAYESVVQKQFSISPEGTLVINNIDGDIKVQTGHKGPVVYLKAVKKSTNPENLAHITINDQTQKLGGQTNLILSTKCMHKDIAGAIDYTLIVPAQMKLKLATNTGLISVKQMAGKIDATTQNGSIELIDTVDALNAHTQKGSITISRARGPIQATAKSGSIIIDHANNSIFAHTDSGSLETHCTAIPENARLLLSSLNGPITLSVPEATNAHVCAHTTKGVLLSDVYITLKQQTLKLNKETWKQFKQTVNGDIGTGKAADIHLSSKTGSIKIVEHKVS